NHALPQVIGPRRLVASLYQFARGGLDGAVPAPWGELTREPELPDRRDGVLSQQARAKTPRRRMIPRQRRRNCLIRPSLGGKLPDLYKGRKCCGVWSRRHARWAPGGGGEWWPLRIIGRQVAKGHFTVVETVQRALLFARYRALGQLEKVLLCVMERQAEA